MRKFCILTTGRAGSTALMDRVAGFPHVAVPGKDIDCRDNELVHPRSLAGNVAAYGQLTGRTIRSAPDLIDAFFEHHGDADLAGFKTMYNRHPDLPRFVRRDDIQFITLSRRDIPATVASFMLAMEASTWRRDGGPPSRTWTFGPEKAARVSGNLEYVFNSHLILRQVPNAIAVTYEDLCRPDFTDERLDAYFGQPVRILDPKPPTDASGYVTNWAEFVGFLQGEWKRLEARHRSRLGK